MEEAGLALKWAQAASVCGLASSPQQYADLLEVLDGRCLPASYVADAGPPPALLPPSATALLPLLLAPSELARRLALCANPDCWMPLMALAQKQGQQQLLQAVSAALPPLQCCGRCGTVAYCSRACQTAHWQDHKEACGVLCQLRKQHNAS